MSFSATYNIIKKLPRYIKFYHTSNVNFSKNNEIIKNPYIKYIKDIDEELKNEFKNKQRSETATLYLRTLQKYYIETYQKND